MAENGGKVFNRMNYRIAFTGAIEDVQKVKT